MRFENKVAVIVGAARGIAESCADIIASERGIIIGIDREEKALSETMSRITSQTGSRCDVVSANALDEKEVKRAVKTVLDRHGRIDILINAVGGSNVISDMDANVEDLSVEDWKRVLDFNMLTCFLFVREIAPQMKRQRSGKIVNISSHAAHGISYRNSAYAAAKAGLGGFTRKLAIELGPFGINVNEIAPGRTLSDRVLRMTEPAEVTARYIEQIPLRRFATPEDQARVICFLASGDADYVTGVTIDVTGGK